MGQRVLVFHLPAKPQETILSIREVQNLMSVAVP